MTIFVLPLNSANPFLKFLYDAVRAEEPDCSTKDFSLRGIFGSLFRRERTIIHIHWESNIYGSRFIILSLLRGTMRFSGLVLARAFGARIVWTLHNLASHDYPHPKVDALGRSIMWRIADAVIVQNRAYAASLAQDHLHTRIEYIPHGNYAGVYGNPIIDLAECKEIRHAFGFDDADIVLLALGLVRPYKHYEHLIDAVLHASKAGISVKLWIAGKGDARYFAQLRARAGDSASIIFREGFVRDEEIPRVLAAANYGIFAYGESSLTSGAMILALTYGLPVIAGDMPAAELVESGANGYRFENDAELDALFAQLPSKKPLDRTRVIESVAPYDWRSVARKTIAVYRSLL